MPYTLPAALTTAMDSGVYEPYLRAVLNSSASDTGASTVEPLAFRKEALRATLRIAKFSNDITKYAHFRLVRGALISGTPSTISSVWFTSIEIVFDGKFVDIKGEVFGREYIAVTADEDYQGVIEFTAGQAAEYVLSSQITYEGTASWKAYKFYPAGRTVVISPAMKLFTLLRQKYLIFGTENLWDGSADNLYFFVATDTRATDYTFTDLLFKGNKHTESRRLLSRDQNNVVTLTGNSIHAVHNLGYIESSASQPTNLANPHVGARSSKIPVHLKYRTGDKAICLGDSSTLNELNSRIDVIEVLDLQSTPAWYQIIEALVWYEGTEGGAMPSTIEAAAPYTPLVTGSFDGILTTNDNNLQAAMETIDDHTHTAANIGVRTKLTADRTYYVRTDGSDSNNGLANTAGGAFLTVQKAIDTAADLDTSAYNITIQIADGTYVANTITCKNILGPGTVTIQGNSGTPANVVIDGGFLKDTPGTNYTIKDLKLTKSSGTATTGLLAQNRASIYFSNLNFGAGLTIHIFAQGAKIEASGNWTISGGASFHIVVSDTGNFIGQSRTVTLTGTPAITYFVYVDTAGICKAASNTFSGAATGTRYYVDLNGVISTGGGGANYFPGNAAGSTATGGQYT